MRLVIDTNRIISALLKDGLTQEIITSNSIDFYSIDYVIEELNTTLEIIHVYPIM